MTEILTNSVILSQSLSDCLEIMIEKGLFVRDLKQTAKRYKNLIDRNNSQIFKNVSPERMEVISQELDQNVEILKKLNSMDFEAKQKVLEGLG